MRRFIQKFKSKKGVTLVELIIAMAIFTVVMTAVSTVFLLSMQNVATTKKIDDALDDVKLKIVLDEYKETTQNEEGEYVTADGYKVEVVTEIKDLKLSPEKEGDSPILIKQPKKFYKITAPNGAVVLKTYDKKG